MSRQQAETIASADTVRAGLVITVLASESSGSLRSATRRQVMSRSVTTPIGIMVSSLSTIGISPQSQSSMVPETNKELIRRIASPARVSAHVCPLLDQRAIDQYNSYNTFVVTFDKKGAMPLDNCDSRRTFSVQLPSRGFAGFDPDKHANQEITVTGMLQNSAAQASGTLFWTVVVRDAQDVCLKPAAQCP